MVYELRLALKGCWDSWKKRAGHGHYPLL